VSFFPAKSKSPAIKEKSDMLSEIEAKLRSVGMIYQPSVKQLLKNAYQVKNPRVLDAILFRLEWILKNYGLLAMRTPDEFRPYCPEELSQQGKLHICNQVDGVKIFDNHHKLTTGLGILGAQGAGKTSYIMHLCDSITKIDASVKITIIDPKAEFRALNGFITLDIADLSFDLKPPSSVQLNCFVQDFTPILSNMCGLIYALAFLEQAVKIALQRREQYLKATGIDPGLCLEDVYEALKSIKVSHFRLAGYHDAALTALLMILGQHKYFSCRAGVDLEWLFSQNVILSVSSLTGDLQCRFLITLMLFWLLQKARTAGQTNKLRHIIIVDDATRFIGSAGTQFDGQIRTSPLGHILAVLRSSGVCFCFATQLPSQIDPSVLSLTRNLVAIGNITGEEHLKVIKNAMSLTEAQKNALTRFKSREILTLMPNSSWPHPIHGWSPDVSIPASYAISACALPVIVPWRSLTDIPAPASTPAAQQTTPVNPAPPQTSSPAPAISSDAEKLIYDCVINSFDNVTEHIKRLGFSVRIYEAAQNEALQNGFLLASYCGKPVYLIPTEKAYSMFRIISPYKRACSIEHSFYVNLAAYYLKKDPSLKVQVETPVGAKGAAIDVTTLCKNGEMIAYEITLNTTNILSNAAKVQGTAYGSVYWLCRDEKTAKAIAAYFKKSAALPSELTDKFKYVSITKWIKTLKKGKP
jgi:hypothetical protein